MKNFLHGFVNNEFEKRIGALDQKLTITESVQKSLDTKLKNYEKSEENIGWFTKFYRWFMSIFSGKYDLYTTTRFIKNAINGGYSSEDLDGGVILAKENFNDMRAEDFKKKDEKGQEKGESAMNTNAE